MPTWLLIHNPRSGASTGDGAASRLRKALQGAGLRCEWRTTTVAGEARRIAAEAWAQGFRHVLVAGGDGTAHEVVDGLMHAAGPASTTLTLGLLPLGTGNDWARTLRVPRDLDAACRLVASGRSIAHDVGLAVVQGADGPRACHFINAAGAGFDAYVVRHARGNGKSRYLRALLRGMGGYRHPRLVVTADGRPLHEGAALTCLLCNGGFLGGGMRVAADADPGDGRLALVLVEGVGPWRILANLHRLLGGTLAQSRWVRTASVAHAEVRGDCWIQADGELLGRAPASFRVLPGALQVVAGGPGTTQAVRDRREG